MIEHRQRPTGYRPHAVRIPEQTELYARPMAVRVGTPLAGPSSRRDWRSSEVRGFRMVLWRAVLSMVHTMWAD